MKCIVMLLLVVVGGVSAAGASCEPGVYRSAGTAAVIVTNRAPAGAPGDYRYMFLDGRRGGFEDSDSPVKCTAGGVAVRQSDGSEVLWTRLPVVETPTRFTNLGTDFKGMLIEPEDGRTDRPLVVVLHGSEKTSAFGSFYPYIFVAQSISVFLYDKRGTGASEGDYTQNFQLLADDAVAASREARRLAAGRHGRWGFFGGSQGGWVAPLAAKLAGADFVTVGFGLVMSPLEEDREQVFFELRRKGHDDAGTLAAAKQVTDATGALIASRFKKGYDQLAAVKKRYADTSWLAQIEGEFTGPILNSDPAELRRTGAARLDGLGIIWDYEALAVIRSLNIPQLWVLAGSDREAPGDVTRTRLHQLIREGKPISLFVFPDTDHGITEYVEAADGSRTITKVADGYFRLLGDWINGRTSAPYGQAEAIQERP